MDRLTGWVLGHRRVVLAGWLVLTLAGLWAAATITDSLSQSFEAPGRPAFAANREIVGTFHSGGVVPPLVLVGRDAADLRRVAAAVPGGRVALPGDPGGGALVPADRRTAAALVFPPPGRPAPDTNPQAVAAAQRAAAGRGVAVTGVDALSSDTGGGGAGVLAETVLGGLGALIVLAIVFASL